MSVAAGDTLAAWSVDVYLGVVVGDALIDSLSADTLAAARGGAEAAMLDALEASPLNVTGSTATA